MSAALTNMDAYRQWLGMVSDLVGLGPQPAPFHTLETGSPLRLRVYTPDDPRGPAALLVPAPIKGSDIWDLRPEQSVVRRYLERGFRVYLVEWPRVGPGQEHLGLEDYAETMLGAALNSIAEDSGQKAVHLAGHSIGGTFAAMHCARHPERIRSLTLLGSPLNFTAGSSQIGEVAQALERTTGSTPAEEVIPGSMLSLLGVMASPEAFVTERASDLMAAGNDPDRMRLHFMVERWTLDERPMPGQLFVDLIERLYRDNDFVEGRIALAGRLVSPADIGEAVASVMHPECQVAPPSAVLPATDRMASARRDVFWYESETGVSIQHVAMMVGPGAHARMWPALLDWALAEEGARAESVG
ncbi:alpha/beta hydrolase [Ectothiorhodospiraceae bacterium WFHF3C12]|nr:alpha/beta hydrolase [Ectothiorhodospiraceae bacterium WFHF3C12]